MGNCNTCEYKKIEKENEIIAKDSGISGLNFDQILSNKSGFELIEQKLTLDTNALRKVSSYKRKITYLFPEFKAKREDIEKKYHIYPNYFFQGGCSLIYIAEKDNTKFAIKKIMKDGIAKLKDIKNEVNITRNLNHKNIISFYEVYEDENYIYLVMELGEEGDLFDFITSNEDGFLPPDIAIDLLIQILDVVDYLHSVKKIIHRDLKPENFLIKFDNENNPIIKLIDFGLSTSIPRHREKLYEIIGTTKYSSPEMLNKIGYNEKIDEWAIGVIMFSMLTGYEPFRRTGPYNIKESILNEEINFEIIQEEELRALNKKLLDRCISTRINCKNAIIFLKKLKQKKENFELIKFRKSIFIKNYQKFISSNKEIYHKNFE